jgi:hypothetical protein
MSGIQMSGIQMSGMMSGDEWYTDKYMDEYTEEMKAARRMCGEETSSATY